MRYLIILLFVTIFLGGCKFTNNIVEPGADQPVSADAVLDSVIYTFTAAHPTISINDSLKATLTAYNQSSATDTIFVGYSPDFYTWSLVNNITGDTLMQGPAGADNSISLVLLASGQSEVLYSINQPITGSSGAAVKPGEYTLRWNLNNGSTNLLWLSINLTLQ